MCIDVFLIDQRRLNAAQIYAMQQQFLDTMNAFSFLSYAHYWIFACAYSDLKELSEIIEAQCLILPLCGFPAVDVDVFLISQNKLTSNDIKWLQNCCDFSFVKYEKDYWLLACPNREDLADRSLLTLGSIYQESERAITLDNSCRQGIVCP